MLEKGPSVQLPKCDDNKDEDINKYVCFYELNRNVRFCFLQFVQAVVMGNSKLRILKSEIIQRLDSEGREIFKTFKFLPCI